MIMVLPRSVVLALALLSLYLASSNATLVQLDSANYTSYLRDVLDPETNVAMEYYTEWAPHRRHFAPTYDLVGAHFMDTEPPTAIVARINCIEGVGFNKVLRIYLSAFGMNCRLLVWLPDGTTVDSGQHGMLCKVPQVSEVPCIAHARF
jgi:hypothetical protein